MKKVLLCLLTLVTVISLAACELDSFPEKIEGGNHSNSAIDKENGGEQSSSNKKEETFGLNDTAVFKTLKFTATKIKEDSGDTYFGPKDGNIFVGIKFTIENISDEEQTISSLLLFEGYVDDVKCSESMTASLAFDGEMLDGSVAPGKKLVGWYAMEVPEDWETIELHVQSDWLSNSKAKFVFEN